MNLLSNSCSTCRDSCIDFLRKSLKPAPESQGGFHSHCQMPGKGQLVQLSVKVWSYQGLLCCHLHAVACQTQTGWRDPEWHFSLFLCCIWHRFCCQPNFGQHPWAAGFWTPLSMNWPALWTKNSTIYGLFTYEQEGSLLESFFTSAQWELISQCCRVYIP